MRTKLLASITLLAAVVTTLAGVSTWSAFSGSTADAGNTFAAGTVAISDNDGGSAMFAFTGVRPGDTDAKCLTVTYTGTLPSLVRLHGATTGSGLDQYGGVPVLHRLRRRRHRLDRAGRGRHLPRHAGGLRRRLGGRDRRPEGGRPRGLDHRRGPRLQGPAHPPGQPVGHGQELQPDPDLGGP
jgi:hypothetical protein